MSNYYDAAARRLYAGYGIACETRRVRLADPPLELAVTEAGSGAPVLLVHGSGMSAATWAPLLAHLHGRRVLALDLPGFGASDAYDYRGRPLRKHAVVQLQSAFDALELERVSVVGTSLGGMWALNLALAAPDRVSALVSLGMPAVALPGLHADPYFRVLTTPGLGRLAARAPAPRSAAATRKAMRRTLGAGAAAAMRDEFFEVVRAGMARPGWGRAMWSHLNLAMRRGRARPENVLTEDELRSLAMPVELVWGDADIYGAPAIGDRAAALLPQGRLHVLPGGHAPFLDQPERCAAVIRAATG